MQNSFMVGDAAGRLEIKKKLTSSEPGYKKDFSCADRMWAANLSIPFYTPEEFFLQEKPRKFEMINQSHSLFPNEESNQKKLASEIEKIKDYQIIMLYGAPASGKSSLSTLLEKDGYHIINQDTLGTKVKCVSLLKQLLADDINQKILLDNTNSKKSYRASFTSHLNTLKIKYCLVGIEVSKEQAFFSIILDADKKERLSDIAIHSYFKYKEEPSR